jgi:hypothetical protein
VMDEKAAAEANGTPATYTMLNLDMDIYDKAMKVLLIMFCCLF